MSDPKLKRFGVPVLFIVDCTSQQEARARVEAALACADEVDLGSWLGWATIEAIEPGVYDIEEITIQ